MASGDRGERETPNVVADTLEIDGFMLPALVSDVTGRGRRAREQIALGDVGRSGATSTTTRIAVPGARTPNLGRVTWGWDGGPGRRYGAAAKLG